MIINKEIQPLDIPSQVLEFYKITDFKRQISGYHNSFAERFAGKILSPEELDEALTNGFYIGEKRCRLGDFLSYTAVPFYLKKRWPEAKIIIRKNDKTKDVFSNNPYVDEIAKIRGRKPVGAFREFGFGNMSQRRLRIFGIFSYDYVKPMLVPNKKLVSKYNEWKEKLRLAGRKLVVVQSGGKSVKKLLAKEDWSKIFKRLEDEFFFLQIGNSKNPKLPAHKVIRKNLKIRELIALMSIADIFLGPNSGLMHVAEGLDIPAVIIHNEADIKELVFPVFADNFLLPQKINHHLLHLYPDNYHLFLDGDPFYKPLNDNIFNFSFENLKTALKLAPALKKKGFPDFVL